MQQESPESQTATTSVTEAPGNNQSAAKNTAENIENSIETSTKNSTEDNIADNTPDNSATESVDIEPVEPPKVPFSDLDLDPRLQQAIADIGFTHCSSIQAESLPHSLEGKDLIGKAQTGTGKTAAFLITVINTLLKRPEQEERYNGEPRTLILAPTRELAMQIEKDAIDLIKHTPLTLMSIVGGMDYKKQQNRLENEIIDIVVGTPGRLIDFLNNKKLFLSEIEFLVIDEADRMLDMGFIPDVKRLIRQAPRNEYRQTLLFSATFNQDIINLSESWTFHPTHIEIEPESLANANVEKNIYITTSEEKFTLLYNIITQKELERVIVFCNRRDETRTLMERLKRKNIQAAVLSGEIPQHKRMRTLEDFRSGKLRVLVATDVAGRGIHIDGISHVVNYTLPEDPEDYVHRIGRTGRAGNTGISISFACEEDAFQIPDIEELLKEKLTCLQPEKWMLKAIG